MVAAALGEPGQSLVGSSPVAIVRSRPNEYLHLPAVEGAFADLVERQILIYDENTKGYQWGPRATEVEAYRACLARF